MQVVTISGFAAFIFCDTQTSYFSLLISWIAALAFSAAQSLFSKGENEPLKSDRLAHRSIAKILMQTAAAIVLIFPILPRQAPFWPSVVLLPVLYPFFMLVLFPLSVLSLCFAFFDRCNYLVWLLCKATMQSLTSVEPDPPIPSSIDSVKITIYCVLLTLAFWCVDRPTHQELK